MIIEGTKRKQTDINPKFTINKCEFCSFKSVQGDLRWYDGKMCSDITYTPGDPN